MMSVRLGKAVDLLLAGEFNVSEIAYKVGFSEPTNFARAFAKVYGKSPKKYVSDISNQPK
jgi:AraC-like DNA-binding protein